MAVLSCWISKVKSIGVTVVVVAILFDVPFGARAWSPQHGSAQVARRTMLETTVPTAVAVGALSSWIPSWKSHAATAASTLQLPTLNELKPTSLAVRLAQRNNAAGLPNRLFNVPPKAQVFPVWLRGDWRIATEFAGFAFPSSRIDKQRLILNTNVPGFSKCSIAATADIGRTGTITYDWSVDSTTGWEGRATNLRHQVDAYLGYPAVSRVAYDATRNPNRQSIDFVDYRTINAERIELFDNARECQEYMTVSANGAPSQVFVCAEYVRQVTFGTGSTVGVPRQAVTNYAHFWTFQRPSSDTNKEDFDVTNSWTGNLLTAAYLDPQDAMFFDEPSQPVALYSHLLQAQRKSPGS
jgi:hypothetical protein